MRQSERTGIKPQQGSFLHHFKIPRLSCQPPLMARTGSNDIIQQKRSRQLQEGLDVLATLLLIEHEVQYLVPIRPARRVGLCDLLHCMQIIEQALARCDALCDQQRSGFLDVNPLLWAEQFVANHRCEGLFDPLGFIYRCILYLSRNGLCPRKAPLILAITDGDGASACE